MKTAKQYFNIDWILFLSTLPLLAGGLITMRALGAGNNYFFFRQIIWILVSFAVFFLFSAIDWRFLRRGELLVALLAGAVAVLAFLLIMGKTVKGAASWIALPFFAIEPSDPIKLLVILILAKYFSRRHIEIAHIRHIIVSGIYVFIPTILIFFQPDFGSAIIFFLIWLGMIMVSGVSKKHLLLVFLAIAITFSVSWFFAFEPYQKDRVLTFLHPLKDIRGAGYNAYQSMIAVGSGQIFGKGIGFGTQSRLEFLPEHQTDFVFAAFAEEWGLVGVFFIFVFFGIVIWRILKNAFLGQGNFESLFGFGLAIFLMAHFIVHIGMNIGLLPITGTTLPFMSYGGSHMITVFGGLGILMGMRRYARSAHREDATAEFLGM
ncbi:MAG: rod shape-determining protein RodA [bacterium]|nr:rod shape-determining protein RodA [bacterium]